MALFRFLLTAKHIDGTPIVGATVRILDVAGVDRTGVIFSYSTPQTDGAGQTDKYFRTENGALVKGTFTIQVTAPGYSPWSVTLPNFEGNASIDATLERAPAFYTDYALELPGSLFVSPLLPVPVSVSHNNYSPVAWEIIALSVAHSDGRVSIFEVPVSPLNGIAAADIRSRIRLHPILNFIPDGEAALADPDFSDAITITAETIQRLGNTPLPDISGKIYAALLTPPSGPENDLSSYATPANGGLIPWITLLPELVAFRGYYAEVSIWLLPESESGSGYELHRQTYGRAGDPIGPETGALLEGSERVQKIRINTDVAPAVATAKMWVTLAGAIVSTTLTVQFR